MVYAPSDPFFSAKFRIFRASEHLRNFEQSADTFFTDDPGGYIAELDANGTHEIHNIKFNKRFPREWSILGTEIIEHLRASRPPCRAGRKSFEFCDLPVRENRRRSR